MKKEKKIFVEKKHTIDQIFDEIKKSNAERIILNVSRDSVLHDDMDLFQDIRKLGNEEKKEIIIESIDDHILEMASLIKLKAVNPVFRVREQAVSDILPNPKRTRQFPKIEPQVVAEEVIEEKNEEALPVPKKRGRKKIEKEIPIQISVGEKEEIVPKEEINKEEEKTEAFVFTPPKKKKEKFSFGKKYFLAWGFLAVVCLIGIWFVVFELPTAHITLFLKKVATDFTETVDITTAATNYSINTPGKIILPGELLRATQNIQMTFKANGKEEVKEKARGILTVYNSYGSSPQIFIATTRFESPNGKIFRTEKQITIPGARIQSGKITPSKIDIEIVADEAGDAYNIEPSSGWKIPGLKGTPKYNGFYGENTKKITGGVSGQHLSATDEDKKIAEDTVTAALKESLQAQMIVLLSEKFKTPEEGTVFQVTKKEFQYPENDPENFVLYMEAEMKKFAFDEETLKQALLEKMKKSISGDVPMKAESFDLSYSSFLPMFENEKMTVTVSGNIIFISDIDINKLKTELRGKTRSDMQKIIYSLPGLENAQTSLEPKWVFWLGSVPDRENKIYITAE